jgi:hypothetical protein
MTSSAPTSPAPVKVFVAADGNGFMADIAEALAEAAGATRRAQVVSDELPAVDGSINLVVAPHEFFELFDAPRHDLQAAAAASVCVGTEQPGTPWFHLAADACRRGPLTLDINQLAVDSMRGYGIPTERLHLGATPSMTCAAIGDERPIDVLFMGGLDDRRGALLAQLAPRLYTRRSDLRLFRFDRPIGAHTPGVVFGADKYALLGSARVLLNLHRERHDLPPGRANAPGAYFEWVRMIDAMANGAAVLTEPSIGHEPLVAGEHFVEAAPDELADALDGLLDDEPRRARIAAAAHRVVTDDLALADTIGPVLDRIERTILPRLAAHVATGAHRRGSWRYHGELTDPVRRLGPFRPYASIRREAKRLALAENRALRRLDALSCLLHHGDRRHVERVATPAYGPARPEVTAVVSLYDYAKVVTDTLDSLAASEGVALEIVVVEDHATDDSRAVVESYIAGHPAVPILLLAKDANEGLAAARNDGFAAARGDFVMVMDADNLVYPTCLERLRATLLHHPDAAATYAILEDFGGRPNLRSAIDWEVGRLCTANYIDAQAMWRRAAWEQLGGYRDDDDHVFGWEDWDLWLRLAASGGRAVLHREILGRYRVQDGSMISLTNLETDDAIADTRRRYPALPWPTT